MNLSNVEEFYRVPDNLLTVEAGVPVYSEVAVAPPRAMEQELARLRNSVRAFVVPQISIMDSLQSTTQTTLANAFANTSDTSSESTMSTAAAAAAQSSNQGERY